MLNQNSIHAIPVLKDNIIWIWIIDSKAIVIDPAIAEPVKKWIEERKLELIAILQTHHHQDHIGGTEELKTIWPKTKIFASKNDFQRIPFQTDSVEGGDRINLKGTSIEVIGVSGHTKNHIAYFIPKQKFNNQNSVLFCGDTLFGGGCGRLFEGTPEDMFIALQKLNSLPIDTKVYCAHEYTESNLRWAATLRPNSFNIKKRLQEVIKTRNKGLITLPTTIENERATNLFIQANSIEELAKLREHKDNWQE